MRLIRSGDQVDEKSPAAVRAGSRDLRLDLRLEMGFFGSGAALAFAFCQKLPGFLDVPAPVSIGEKAEVADSDIAVGQHMLEKATDEFGGIECHQAEFLGPVVPPAESDFAISDVGDSVVGDGDPMGISAEIVEDLLWTAERLLGIDDPLVTTGLANPRGIAARVLQFGKLAVKLESSLPVGFE